MPNSETGHSQPVTPQVVREQRKAKQRSVDTPAFITGLRRASAFAVWIVAITWVLGLIHWHRVSLYIGEVLERGPFHPSVVLGFTLLVWVLTITQMRWRWVVLIIPYLVFAPIGITLFWLATVFGDSVFLFVADQFFPEEVAKAKKEEANRGAKLLKWYVVLWLVWIVASSGYSEPWMSWIPAALTLPIWISTLRRAYRYAVAPPNVLASVLQFLERKIRKNLEAHSISSKKESTHLSALEFWWMCAKGVIRYQRTRHQFQYYIREAIVVFSVSLAAAIVVSVIAIGLIGQALWRYSPEALQAYSFFRDGSLLEAMLWALGSMTTAIDFPGKAAPLFINVVHGGILSIGLFQLTYLLACFSIMAASHTETTMNEVSRASTNLESYGAHIETLVAEQKAERQD